MRPPHSLIDFTRAVSIAILCACAASAEAQVGFTGAVNDFTPPSVGATDLVLEHDALGNVFAVWTAGANIWAARRTPGSRVWGEPTILQNPTNPTGEPEDPDIAIDDQGNAVVVWWRRPPADLGGIVEYASFQSGSVNQWTMAATVPGPVNAFYPEVVIDGLQRVSVTWYELNGSLFNVKSARYEPALPGWSSVRLVGGSGNAAIGGHERLVIDLDKNITAIWTFVNTGVTPQTYAIITARYNSTTDTWTPATSREIGEGQGRQVQLVVDAAGNVTAMWGQPEAAVVPPASENTNLRFARFNKAAGTWGSPATIPGTFNVEDEHVAALPNGDLMAVWAAPVGSDDIAQASRFQLSAGTWTAIPVTLSAPGGDADVGDVETDGLGNAFAVWNRSDGVQEIAQASRYSTATGAWSSVRDLGAMGDDGEDVQVALNAAGNAVFGWEYEDGPTSIEKVQWTEWLAIPKAPSITGLTPGAQSLSVAFTPPQTAEPAFAATHYEYLLQNVASPAWTGGAPPFTSSPITIQSLTTGATYVVRLRAWNAAGAGLASNAESTAGSVTPVPFTDNPIQVGITSIKAVHITELRQRIDGLRIRFGLAVYPWTDHPISAGTTGIRVVHLTQLRTALSQAYATAGVTQPSYTDPGLSAGMPIKAVHITQLRAAVAAIE